MSVLFVLPAATVYELQGRACGWRATPASRDALKQLRELIPRLRELGATRVICSDLDSQSGKLIARRLNVPYEEWNSLRRFNWGKLHGSQPISLDKWDTNPDIPIKGGDSRTSFNKRVSATGDKLKSLQSTTVVVAPSEIVLGVTKAEAKLERNRVYAWLSH